MPIPLLEDILLVINTFCQITSYNHTVKHFSGMSQNTNNIFIDLYKEDKPIKRQYRVSTLVIKSKPPG